MAVISTISHLLLFPGSIDPNKLSQNHRSTVISLKGRFFRNPRSSKLVALASGGGANGNGEIKEEKEAGDHWEALKRDRRLTFTLRWLDLLNPDPENILAVGLTGLLAWASVQVLWQVFFISFAIVLAALKVAEGLSDPRERITSSLINFPASMANALVFRQSLLHRSHLPAFPRSIFFPQAIRFASGSSSSAPPTRRSPPPPPHEFLKPCDFLGSWKPPSDPREAEARLDRLRKDYAKQIAQLRKEYSLEMEILRAEKQRKDEAKREAIRQANEKRKAAKSAAEETLAVQRKAFQEEFRQTLLNERAEKLESWRKKEQLREQRKTEKKHLLRQQSSMWISEENLDKRILEAIVDTTPL